MDHKVLCYNNMIESIIKALYYDDNMANLDDRHPTITTQPDQPHDA